MPFTKQQKIEKAELFKQGLKQCPRCDEPKPLSEFNKSLERVDGLQVYCKEHEKEQKKENRNKPENKEKEIKYGKIYRDENKEKIAKKNKKYRNRPENKIKAKEYNNKLENKERRNKYQKARRKSDNAFRLMLNLRTRVNKVLSGNNKSLTTMLLIGCDIDYLMYHLQSQFTKGMTWDNYGKGGWQVDHIKPCSKFDLTDSKQQELCFNFKNLQPLWAIDNMRKGNKY